MNKFWGPFTQAPNLLILMTDQQRTAQHLPAGWVENHLPNLTHLMKTGVHFPNAMTNASPCSPARGVLWTGTFPWVNGVTGNSTTSQTSLSRLIGTTVDGGPNQKGSRLLGTLGQMLVCLAPSGVVYDIAYKGKWHLDAGYQSALSAARQQQSRALESKDDADMAATFGFPAWTSPDFGTAVELTDNGGYTLGGGMGGNDARVACGTSYTTGGTVDSASGYLARRFAGGAPASPFCLITSLVNPHDIWVAPAQYVRAGYLTASGVPPWQQPPFSQIKDLPATYFLSQAAIDQKPQAQNGKFRPGPDQADALDYLRFYAFLETLADALLGQVLAALPADQVANTLIVRLADHGEMAMSQGGMTEKENQAYNETLLVPMIFSHPGLPQGEACPGLAGLVDIVPTLAEICGLENPADKYAIQGTSLASAILAGKDGTTYSQHLFQNPITPVYALIDDQQYRSKYVVTANATAWQCELYDFRYDPMGNGPWPSEAENRIPVNGLSDGTAAESAALQTLWRNMHLALTAALVSRGGLPGNWPAPPLPAAGQ